MVKHLQFRSEAREKVLRGATALTDLIRVTLGPKSRCVLIDKNAKRKSAMSKKFFRSSRN